MKQTDQNVRLAEFVRQRRKALQLKQADIAAAMRVEPESVRNWETERRRIELDKLPRLAAILEVNPKDLGRLALFEWHPCFHCAMFGSDPPGTPRWLERVP
jgi:transcriptional regulator with XRE-family HTH domain